MTRHTPLRLACTALSQSTAGNFVARHCAIMTTAGYAGGNAIMMAKEGLVWNFDTVAGAGLFASSVVLMAAQRHPVTAYRVAGALCAGASVFLAAKALNLDTEQAINTGKLVGAGINFGIGILAGFQKEIAGYGERTAGAASTLFNRAVQGFTQYPIVIAAGLDAAATAGIFLGAMQDGDTGMKIAMTGWALGVINLAATDPRYQQRHARMAATRALFRRHAVLA